MTNNPYISIVGEDSHILSDTEKIYSNIGNWNKFFGNDNEIFLEIGTGLGNFFSIESSLHRDKNFIGMEIRYKRLFKTAEKTRNLGVENFVVLKDFGQNIDKIFGNGEVSKTYIFFPDPWDKKDRQKKHKLLQVDFIKNLYKITKIGGKVCFKTDHLGYFEEVLEIVKSENIFKIDFLSYDYERESETFHKQKLTEFESMFRGENLKINYVEFIK